MTTPLIPYPVDGTPLERARFETKHMFVGDNADTIPRHQRVQHVLHLVTMHAFREHGSAELPHSLATATVPDYRSSAGGHDAS